MSWSFITNHDFIHKLKTCIETVRSQIDDLNEALKDAQFGQDSYQFVVTPAQEEGPSFNRAWTNNDLQGI